LGDPILLVQDAVANGGGQAVFADAFSVTGQRLVSQPLSYSSVGNNEKVVTIGVDFLTLGVGGNPDSDVYWSPFGFIGDAGFLGQMVVANDGTVRLGLTSSDVTGPSISYGEWQRYEVTLDFEQNKMTALLDGMPFTTRTMENDSTGLVSLTLGINNAYSQSQSAAYWDNLSIESNLPPPADSCCDALAFLAPYGLENFSEHYFDALNTFLCAQQLYDAGDYAGARVVLDGLWAQHPTGGHDWASLPPMPFGINLGTPTCYYGLRMLSDMTDWRLANPDAPPAARTARLTVLIVGQSNGVEPQTVQDITVGTGVPVAHAVDARVTENDYAVVHESLKLFNEYTFAAMTQGRLDVETHLLPLPDLDLPVVASVTPGGTYYAGLDYSAALGDLLWSSVPEADIEATDWWWLIYPSHVPEQYPVFEDAAFITGGMGVGPDAISPMFIIDDRWLVRKPAHLGEGEYSTIERSVYLPQWLQHEFYHHLYRTYPGYGLEDEGHQWFDLGTWPADFEGRYEPDYYHESLYKRLHFADPGLHAALRYATADAPWDELTIDDVLGEYRRKPVENDWHTGNIQLAGAQLEWLNSAGVSWDLSEDLLEGRLLTAPDCPYYGRPNGQSFELILSRNAIGDITRDVVAFSFLGELYECRPAPSPIPTLSEWGMMALGALILWRGILLINHRGKLRRVAKGEADR
jgi:hypothetical protein